MKMPFYNHDAEAAVIAALTTGKRDVAKYVYQLSSEDFHDRTHRALYQAIQRVCATGKHVTLVTVADALPQNSTLDANLIDIQRTHAVDGWAIDSHIEILKAATMRRDLHKRLEDATAKLSDPDMDVAAVLEDTRQSLRDMVITGHAWKEMPDVLLASYEAIEKRQKGEIKSMPSGIKSLDSVTSGFHRGELTIIGARPAVGKSALGMHIALATAAQGYKVGICSREMTDVQYGTRILSSRADVEPGKIRTGDLNDADWEQLNEAVEHYSPLNVSFMFTAREVEDLRMEVQNKVDSGELDMLMIDYLQLLQTRRRFEKDYQRIAYISKAIKDMTTDFNIPIIALAQVGRSSAGEMPSLAELRGSGDIEQDADNVIFMHRPEDLSDKSIHKNDAMLFEQVKAEGKQYIVLEIAKQRQGQTGKTAVIFDPARMRYTGIARN